MKVWLKRVFLALLLVYCAGLILDIAAYGDRFQWDFRVYYHASSAYFAGLNPYATSDLSQVAGGPIKLPFVYPPLTLFFFRLFTWMEYRTAAYLWLGLKSALLAGTIYLWRNEFLKEEADPLFYLFCLLAFNTTIYLDLRAGNIAILEQLLLWLALLFFLKRRLFLFCLFIVLLALFKATFALLLFLLFFSKEPKRVLYFWGAAASLVAAVFLPFLFTPHLFSDFVANASGLYDLNDSSFRLIREILTIIGRKTSLSIPSSVTIAAFLAVAAGVVWGTWRAMRTILSSNSPDSDRTAIFLACVAYALILPRLKDYSFIILIVPAYFVIKKAAFLPYPLLFLFGILPRGTSLLPGFRGMFTTLWSYYPLIVAFGLWALYLYQAFGNKNQHHLRGALS
jgi:hypothetical protein